MTNVVGFTPRADQREVLDHPARFKILNCGRRWGKTLLASNWMDDRAINRGGLCWWIAPVYAQARLVYRSKVAAAVRGGAAAIIKDRSDSELRLAFHNGGVEHFKSADNFDALRGAGLGAVVLDEASRQDRRTWEEVIRPALSDTKGEALISSTPKGKNWFYSVYSAGQDPLQPAFQSWTFPTSANPLVPAEDIAQAKASLPADIFAQEYEATFLDDQAGVFRHVAACATTVPAEPVPGATYYAGLDLARLSDFTVLSILDEAGAQVFIDRFNLLDWAIQERRIGDALRRYNNARCLVDSTGIGDPIYDALRRMGLRVEGYKFTSESKGRLVEFLQIAFDQQKVQILPDKVQRTELEIYEYTMGRSGVVSYNAPEGDHDDTVVALALAWWMKGHRVAIGCEVH